MKKWYSLIGIVLIAVFCFLGTTCEPTDNQNNQNENENENGNENEVEDEWGFEYGGEYYLSSKAPQTAESFRDITATQLVSEMIIGWNLGNTLDASGGETSWVSHRTNQSNIDAIKEAGFNTIRIPVTWYKTAAMSNMSSYKISDAWMDRVTEIVNYAVNNDMYIIINTHHDEGIFKFGSVPSNAASQNPKPVATALSDANKMKSLEAFHAIWSQIAYNFKNYNEKLIFEGLNEPRTKDSRGEWNGGTADEREVLNEYYRLFVKIVRESGGNNDKRILSINPYAASAFNPAVNDLTLPTDIQANIKDGKPTRLIVQIHCYNPYNFALNTSNTFNTWSKTNSSDTSSITSIFTASVNKFKNNGIPVIVGEFGAMSKNNDEARKAWAEFYVSEAKKRGIPCILWDNGAFTGSGERFAIIDRTNNTFPNPLYLEGLMRGAGIIE